MVTIPLLTLVLAADPTITAFAGTGEKGFSGDGGPATRAKLDQPFDVAFDKDGNLYFSDTFNHRIRRVAAKTGVITTVAGTAMVPSKVDSVDFFMNISPMPRGGFAPVSTRIRSP